MNKSDIKKIIANFGKENQKNKAIEELSELIIAITKKDIENIKEEIVDVFIMLTQLIEIYEIGDIEFSSMIDFKINRTLKKIEEA